MKHLTDQLKSVGEAADVSQIRVHVPQDSVAGFLTINSIDTKLMTSSGAMPYAFTILMESPDSPMVDVIEEYHIKEIGCLVHN